VTTRLIRPLPVHLACFPITQVPRKIPSIDPETATRNCSEKEILRVIDLISSLIAERISPLERALRSVARVHKAGKKWISLFPRHGREREGGRERKLGARVQERGSKGGI